MNVYQTLEQLVDPIVKHYRDDFLIHDRKHIEENPGEPFLIFARETGTHLVDLGTNNLPPWGETVPYLFGSTDRRRQVAGFGDLVRWILHNDEHVLTIYYDGRFVRVINDHKVPALVEQWQRIALLREGGQL